MSDLTDTARVVTKTSKLLEIKACPRDRMIDFDKLGARQFDYRGTEKFDVLSVVFTCTDIDQIEETNCWLETGCSIMRFIGGESPPNYNTGYLKKPAINQLISITGTS